jgi:hypothetical protein
LSTPTSSFFTSRRLVSTLTGKAAFCPTSPRRCASERIAFRVPSTLRARLREHRATRRSRQPSSIGVESVHTPERASINVWEAAQLQRGRNEGIERGTMRGYDALVRIHIGPTLGAAKLATPRDTSPWVSTSHAAAAIARSAGVVKDVLLPKTLPKPETISIMI